MKRIISTAIVLAGLLATVATTGCTQQKTTSAESKPVMQTQPAEKPAPKPRVGWPTRVDSSTMNWSAMAYPTGDPRTSAIGIEKGMPREVSVGQQFDYELVVTNLSNNELQDVVVTDVLGENFRVTRSVPPGRAGANGAMTWDLGMIGPKQSKVIRLTGTAAAEGEVCSCASVTYNSTLCACAPVVQPRLRLTKSGPAEVLKCDEITYRFEVSNPGSGALKNVRITDQLPAGLANASGGGRTITIDAGSLAPGASKPFTAKVMAERTGTFQNKATAAGGGLTVESGTVTTVVRQPVLRVEATCEEQEFIGRPLDYRIVVTNTGDGAAREAVLEDVLPAGVEFVSASSNGRFAGGKITWDLGTLAPRASKTVTARVRPQGSGTYRHTARANAYCAQLASDSCETKVVGIPAILLEVIDIEDPIEVGDNETYVITVTNQGSIADTNIRIVCTLEANQQHVSNSGATAGTARASQIVFQPLASLAPKAKATWRVVVKNVTPGDVRFKVTLTSDELTRPVEETEATNVYR